MYSYFFAHNTQRPIIMLNLYVNLHGMNLGITD